ncbi:phospholipase D family protein [uncultured Muribaculum sp.]|uniref:phospholipase D family protein n=1 Tax=uncultured Muribaculum sp. TaxID=1918613 RepID=UPI0025B79A08|nr:phospholipase D family protein [uncultured Muribaculum sp.]
METIIIGQGYNLTENTSVAQELINQFESNRYSTFTCLVAFASYGGISALTKYILDAKEKGVIIKVILGVDQQGTSKEALEEVLTWGVDAKIYHTLSAPIFHPKIYLFENEDIFTMIVGSNNLTEMGLVKNVECSLLIKDIRSNPVYGKFHEYWKSILNGSENNLYTITQEIIDKLYKNKIITSELDRTIKYDNSNKKSNETEYNGISFSNTKIQKNPKGFVPKRLITVKTTTTGKSGQDEDPIIDNKSFPIEEEVLIAEIGAGTRWKQINFPIQIFQNFFGAEKGNNNYRIELVNIAKDGTLGEVENRQAVSVKSNNFRFEINCAETNKANPSGEDRPIGIFVKLEPSKFLYQVIMPDDSVYVRIKNYLYNESTIRRKSELRRHIVHVEAIHALYPELII